jgi:serine/threonine-protein kinase RsbW
VIRILVPGTLLYRDVVLRVVASSCKLARGKWSIAQRARQGPEDRFDNQVVSAASEVFNNIAIHGYGDSRTGNVEIELDIAEDAITLRFADTGKSFDPRVVAPPNLGSLPESHMGLFIVRSFVDEVSYTPGDGSDQPNRLFLVKRY